MRQFSKQILNWWTEKGKLLAFRLLVLILFLATAARQFEPFQRYIPEEKFLLLMVGPLLLLMLEIIMEAKPETTTEELVLSEVALSELRLKLPKSSSLDISASSTESIYLALRDSLTSAKKMRCRIIFRNPPRGDQTQYEKLKRYMGLWKDLEKENKNLKVETRFTSSNILLRLIIVDRTDVYFGFYKWDGKRYWGHNVPMIHTKPGSNLGNYLLDIANNAFESLWIHALVEPSFREE